MVSFNKKILNQLLKDKTTKKNIIWASLNYINFGVGFDYNDEIVVEKITGIYGSILKSRFDKAKEEKDIRTKNKAEVFTPSWICNKMNNFLDEDYFDKKNIFNKEDDEKKTWKTNNKNIIFDKKHKWQDYIKLKKMEQTCGEAPFIISKYDMITGKEIALYDRIGFLDRKLRIINENENNEKEWFKWIEIAYKNTYGYEYQGDNLLIARINILSTFIDNVQYKWRREPSDDELKKIINIICYNIWQMDGLKYNIPYANCRDTYHQYTIFELMDGIKEENKQKENVFCKIKNWDSNKIIEYKNIEKGKNKMKFDYIVSNPPYQETRENTSDMPVYHLFLDSAYKVADVVETINPARYLFNAGKTPEEWNKKMLNDVHLKILMYEIDSSKMFGSGVDIKGGVVIQLYNNKKTYESIGVFSSFDEMRSIYQKIKNDLANNGNLSQIMILQNRYNLENLFMDHPELQFVLSKDGKERRMVSSCFEKNSCFTEERVLEDDFKVLGIQKLKRIYKYINKKYIEDNGNLMKYKVIIPNSNGSGAIGEVISTPLIGEPLIGEPLIGYTQSFIGVGSFDSKNEAENALKYVKSKFCRATLGLLKATQSNSPDKWLFVPLQDFTTSSDIDWSKSISEIDKQLYKKYNLSDNEIEFIEKNVKEMN